MPVTIHLWLNETKPFAVGTHIGIEDMSRSQGNCPLSWRNRMLMNTHVKSHN